MTNDRRDDLAPSGNPFDDARQYLQSTGTDGWLTRYYRYTNSVYEAALGRRVEHITGPVCL